MLDFGTLLMGSASIPQVIIFYSVATLDLTGCVSVWLFRQKKWLNCLLAFHLLVLCLIYLTIVSLTLITRPMLLLNMSLSGVQQQFSVEWIQISSVAHFAVTDIITSRVLLYLLQYYGLIDGHKFYYYIPLYFLSFLWCPIAVLACLLIIINPFIY